MYSLLKELCEAPAVAGRENAVIAIMKREFLRYSSDVSIDGMGNVTAVKKCGKPGAKKIMVSAHMDESGAVVSHIDRNGFIHFSNRGRLALRNIHSQRVKIYGKNGPIYGSVEGYPIPFLSDEVRPQASKVEQLFIDTGMTESEVREHVGIGDMIVIESTLIENGNTLFAKAFDDRLGCFLLVEALKRVKQAEVDLYMVATVQEEVGLRGAMRAAREINPDIGIALDVTMAFDLPGVAEQLQVSRLGGGVAIKISDTAFIANHGIVEQMKALAREYGIKHQMEILPHGGTEARSIQMFGQGAVGALSVPTRHIHTPNEIVHKDDVEAAAQLLTKFLENAHLCQLDF